MIATVDRTPLRKSLDGEAGFVDNVVDGELRSITMITDHGKNITVDVPLTMRKMSLRKLLKNYSVIDLFKDQDISYYNEKPFDEKAFVTVEKVVSIPGEQWIGKFSFDNPDIEDIFWQAQKTWDNKVFERGDEVEHSERIYASPKSFTGWEIKIPQPMGYKSNEFILRRRLASIVEELIAKLETDPEEVKFPTPHQVTNLIVRKPHKVNLPYIYGLGDEIY